ncbi:MAG TPA: MMPL family transporter, partial [Candidatus Limnocylindrales bacterium]
MSRFERLGSVVYRHRRAVIATWGLVLLLALPFAPRAGGALRAGGFTLDTLESARARTLLVAELHLPPSALVVVFHSDQLIAGGSSFEAAVASAMARVPDSPHVVSVLSHRAAPRLVSADGHTAYDIVFLDLAPDDSPLSLPTVEAALGPAPGVAVALAGGPAFYGDVQTVSEADLRRSEAISLPLAGLTLIVVFGSLVAAAVPLAVGGSAVVVALAVIFGLASLTPMSIFVLNLATLLGLGLGVDYSLLLTSRFREELAKRAAWRDLPPGQARDLARAAAVETSVRITVATAGRAVFFSGLTVLLGLVGLILFQFMILRSVGIAGAVVVGLAVLAALTLLPAILGVLGPRLDALAIRRVTVTPGTEGPWARLARAVMRRPVAVLVPTLALLLVLGSPFLSVRFNAPDATILPPSVPSRASYELLAREFGEGAFAPLTLAIRTPTAATAPASLAALYDYSRRLAADPRVT